MLRAENNGESSMPKQKALRRFSRSRWAITENFGSVIYPLGTYSFPGAADRDRKAIHRLLNQGTRLRQSGTTRRNEMANHPPLHGSDHFPFFMEDSWEELFDGAGFRLASTVLVGGVAILANIFAYYILSVVKWLINKYLIPEDLRFIVEWLFTGLNLTVTGVTAYVADRKLRLYWARQKLSTVYEPQWAPSLFGTPPGNGGWKNRRKKTMKYGRMAWTNKKGL